MGPTASGKSEVAEKIAKKLNTKIVNADAFQVYKGLDIGTNKPTERSLYQGLDLILPNEPFSVGKFLQLAEPIVRKNLESNNPTVVCGGTGLYVRALLEGYKTSPSNKSDRARIQKQLENLPFEKALQSLGIQESPPMQTAMNSRHLSRWIERKLQGEKEPIAKSWIPYKLKIGLKCSRAFLLKKIEARLERMFELGWVNEVQNLRNQGIDQNCPGFKAIGYREISEFLETGKDIGQTKMSILVQTRQYAKRQMTWLNKEPDLIWLNAERTTDEIVQEAMSLVK